MKKKVFTNLNTGKHLKLIGDLFSKYFSTTEAKDELEKFKKTERQTN